MERWQEILVVALVAIITLACLGWLEVFFWIVLVVVIIAVIGFILFLIYGGSSSSQTESSRPLTPTREVRQTQYKPAYTYYEQKPTPSPKTENPENTIYMEKGYRFERYVINLFEVNNRPDRKYFEMVDWTRDINKKNTGVNVTSNQFPDLWVRYSRRDNFAVECKFRQSLIYSKEHNCKVLKWSYPAQIRRYKDFQKERNMPVFIVIGVGGEPDNPKQMYRIPLDEATSPEIPYYLLQRYWRPPGKPFFWRDNYLH